MEKLENIKTNDPWVVECEGCGLGVKKNISVSGAEFHSGFQCDQCGRMWDSGFSSHMNMLDNSLYKSVLLK